MAGLVVIYFIQVVAFALAIDRDKMAPLFTSKGAILAVYFLILLAIGAFVVVQASTLALWSAARLFNGQGTLQQTRAAVIWTLLGSIPIGFFWLILYFAYTHQELLGKAAPLIAMVSYASGVATLIYMLIVLLVTLSETNKIGLWKAFFSLGLGSIILTVMAYLLLPVYHLLLSP